MWYHHHFSMFTMITLIFKLHSYCHLFLNCNYIPKYSIQNIGLMATFKLFIFGYFNVIIWITPTASLSAWSESPDAPLIASEPYPLKWLYLASCKSCYSWHLHCCNVFMMNITSNNILHFRGQDIFFLANQTYKFSHSLDVMLVNTIKSCSCQALSI